MWETFLTASRIPFLFLLSVLPELCFVLKIFLYLFSVILVGEDEIDVYIVGDLTLNLFANFVTH